MLKEAWVLQDKSCTNNNMYHKDVNLIYLYTTEELAKKAIKIMGQVDAFAMKYNWGNLKKIYKGGDMKGVVDEIFVSDVKPIIKIE